MKLEILRIGVVSDLHCHSIENNNGIRDSLITDEEVPIFQDPYKSFLYLIETTKKIEVDILVVAGDLSNKACPVGLKMGYNIITEISKVLNAEILVTNIGNHDVDSRKIYSSDPVKQVKELKPFFPFNSKENFEYFWDNGFQILEFENYRLLIINTAHNHNDAKKTEHGDISEESLKFLEDNLDKLENNKLGIAVTHHSPIEHSHFNSGITDFMHNGDDLSKIIDKYGFKLLIHGHKHDPRLRQMPGGVNSPFIFSSGSFSAVRERLLLGGVNTFHVISLNLMGKNKGQGKIDTWFFTSTKGWNKDIRNQYFESEVGFGAFTNLDDLSSNIVDFIRSSSNNIVSWSEVVKTFPEIEYLIPTDIEKLEIILKQSRIKLSASIKEEFSSLQYK